MKVSPPSAFATDHRQVRGFTLIELMITVAIVAILTAIAYPSYRNYVIRSQVVNATNGLSSMQANMERFFQDNRQYTAVNGFTPPCTPPGVTVGNFTISCPTVLTATTFVLEADGAAGVNGFTYKIDQTGTQSSSVASPAPSAWILTCPSTWEMKAGTC